MTTLNSNIEQQEEARAEKRNYGPFVQLGSIIITVLLSVIGAMWVTGSSFGGQQAKLQSLTERQDKLENSLSQLQKDILSNMRDNSDKMEDLRVSVEQLRVELKYVVRR